jgi:hypothetical protein
MPRIRRGIEEHPRLKGGDLVDRLAHELRFNRDTGQPVIYEQEFPTGNIRVTVIWDEWDHLTLEERTSVVLRAYESAFGRTYRDRIALASGLTFPEAHASGMLPFQIISALRKGDPITLEECRQAMIDEGASTLLSADQPQLRFATQEEAEAARKRLSQRLLGSEPVWVVSQDIGKVDFWSQ